MMRAIEETSKQRSVLQGWVMVLPFMQQSVLIAAMRGPDGVDKNHPSKALCKWLRRCIVISAFDKRPLNNPYVPNGGSYTGPSLDISTISLLAPGNEENCDVDPIYDWETPMNHVVKTFLSSIDSLPHHFTLHFIHAAEIIGYKHSNDRIREWWKHSYRRMCHDFHMSYETEAAMDARLNDDEATWRKDESRFKK